MADARGLRRAAGDRFPGVDAPPAVHGQAGAPTGDTLDDLSSYDLHGAKDP